MFSVQTETDFYSMLIEDFDDFVAEPHSARRAMYCSISHPLPSRGYRAFPTRSREQMYEGFN